jgi:ABC-type lipoprotein export system ATPase subunit
MIVVVTHHSIAASIGDKALFLTDGRIVGAMTLRPVMLDGMMGFGDSRC